MMKKEEKHKEKQTVRNRLHVCCRGSGGRSRLPAKPFTNIQRSFYDPEMKDFAKEMAEIC